MENCMTKKSWKIIYTIVVLHRLSMSNDFEVIDIIPRLLILSTIDSKRLFNFFSKLNCFFTKCLRNETACAQVHENIFADWFLEWIKLKLCWMIVCWYTSPTSSLFRAHFCNGIIVVYHNETNDGAPCVWTPSKAIFIVFFFNWNVIAWITYNLTFGGGIKTFSSIFFLLFV